MFLFLLPPRSLSLFLAGGWRSLIAPPEGRKHNGEDIEEEKTRERKRRDFKSTSIPKSRGKVSSGRSFRRQKSEVRAEYFRRKTKSRAETEQAAAEFGASGAATGIISLG
jgi:hypothetical protein